MSKPALVLGRRSYVRRGTGGALARDGSTRRPPVRHVNRVLNGLDRDGLIERDRRFLRIPQWEALRDAAGFSETYLPLEQTPAGIARAAGA